MSTPVAPQLSAIHDWQRRSLWQDMAVYHPDNGVPLNIGDLKGDLKSFRLQLERLGIDQLLPVADGLMTREGGSPLAKAMPCKIAGKTPGNKIVIHPMEGWDGTTTGYPTRLGFKRAEDFGKSGAKLIWFEATAVEAGARANPNQLYIDNGQQYDQTKATGAQGLATAMRECNSRMDGAQGTIKDLFDATVAAHQKQYGRTDDLVTVLQLTHSGRWSKPNHNDKPEPRIMYHHPVLDKRVGIKAEDNSVVFSDDQLDLLVDKYVAAAKKAKAIGFDMVDIKACHGYLLHEALGAFSRTNPDGTKSKYGGESYEDRTRLLKTIIKRVQDEAGIKVAVRLSAFDTFPLTEKDETVPHMKGPGMLKPPHLTERFSFGTDAADAKKINLDEPKRLIKDLYDMGVELVNLTAGSPYYSSQIQRPTIKPTPGNLPPEEPLHGIARLVDVGNYLRTQFPEKPFILSGLTGLRDFLPHVCQAISKKDPYMMFGLGRMALSYPDLFEDVFKHGSVQTDREDVHLCTEAGDCTKRTRMTDANGRPLVSGCTPHSRLYTAMSRAELRGRATFEEYLRQTGRLTLKEPALPAKPIERVLGVNQTPIEYFVAAQKQLQTNQ